MAEMSLSLEHPETKRRAVRKTSLSLSSCELLVRSVTSLEWQDTNMIM